MSKNVAVIFDMDGVLVDSNPYHKLAFQDFLKKHNVELADDELKMHVYGRANKEIMPYIFKNDFTAEKGEMWADEKEAIFRNLFESEMKPVKGLVAFLDELKTEDIKIAVGTSAPQVNLDFVLDKIGIRKYFDVLVHSAHVKFGKPNPDIYLNAAAKLHIDPVRCIVVEDSLAGVKAGLNANMKVIGITTTHSAEELEGVQLVVNDFTELSVENILCLL